MRYIFLHSDRKIRYNILDIVRKGSIENARKRVDDLYLDSSYSNIYLAKGRSRLRKSFENIHSLCRDKRQERGLLWVLTALSAVFKTSTPCLLK